MKITRDVGVDWIVQRSSHQRPKKTDTLVKNDESPLAWTASAGQVNGKMHVDLAGCKVHGEVHYLLQHGM